MKKPLLNMPVRKPAKEWFIRTHPEESFRLKTIVLELKEAREIYFPNPSLRDALAGEAMVKPVVLQLGITRQGVIFIWPLNCPVPTVGPVIGHNRRWKSLTSPGRTGSGFPQT